ncbi:hypothetical protein FRC07_005405 [Ceratobasidium sp. 392]|nr:hypothetical protein FRC07_005405 [Ceratobasidium sp. 392]
MGKAAKKSTARPKKNPIAKGPYECKTCNTSWKKLSEYNRHAASHLPESERENLCTICGSKFTQKPALKTHVKTHLRIRDLLCGFEGCSSDFTDASSRARHEREVHNTAYGLKCNQCDFTCKRRADFVQHCLDSHNVEPTKEDVKMAKKAHLEDHAAQVEQGIATPVPENTRKRKGRTSPSNAGNSKGSVPAVSTTYSQEPDSHSQIPIPSSSHQSNQYSRSDLNPVEESRASSPSSSTGISCSYEMGSSDHNVDSNGLPAGSDRLLAMIDNPWGLSTDQNMESEDESEDEESAFVSSPNFVSAHEFDHHTSSSSPQPAPVFTPGPIDASLSDPAQDELHVALTPGGQWLMTPTSFASAEGQSVSHNPHANGPSGWIHGGHYS